MRDDLTARRDIELYDILADGRSSLSQRTHMAVQLLREKNLTTESFEVICALAKRVLLDQIFTFPLSYKPSKDIRRFAKLFNLDLTDPEIVKAIKNKIATFAGADLGDLRPLLNDYLSLDNLSSAEKTNYLRLMTINDWEYLRRAKKAGFSHDEIARYPFLASSLLPPN
ncbi:MAG: hypothetical protein LBS45_09340 [Synergistaceae bacterium]|jgi:hypothetical protein|nr:hypothetical protein [Synergistaceae bacterium]